MLQKVWKITWDGGDESFIVQNKKPTKADIKKHRKVLLERQPGQYQRVWLANEMIQHQLVELYLDIRDNLT